MVGYIGNTCNNIGFIFILQWYMDNRQAYKIILLFSLLLVGCYNPVDKEIKSKGIVTGFFEVKGTNSSIIKATIQDTSGKIFFVAKKICEGCLINDSVKLLYHDNSLIEDGGDKFEVDSCVKFYNVTWKAEKYTKTLYFYDDSGRLIKKIDTTFIKQ